MKKALKIVLAVLGLGLAVYAFCLYMNYHMKQIEHKKNEQIIQQKRAAVKSRCRGIIRSLSRGQSLPDLEKESIIYRKKQRF